MKDTAALYRRVTSSAWMDRGLVAAVAVVGVVGIVVRELGAGSDLPMPAFIGLLLVSGATAALLRWRRSHPTAVLLGGMLAVIVAAFIRPPGLAAGQVVIELILVCFAIGSWSRRIWLPGILLVGLMIALTAGSRDTAPSLWNALALALALVALPAVAGLASRARRDYLRQVEQRLVEAERERDERARVALRDERARIARELHDVVAHHVSLIGIQAGAARTALAAAPDHVAAALSAIEATSRDAIVEMRHLLQALRPLDGPEPTDPQPGLHRIGELVQGLRGAGYDLTVRADGVDESLPPGLSLSAYRVVEEALTNVTRHSAARTADVTVVVTVDEVTVTVEDPGPGVRHRPHPVASSPGAEGGRGLIGMAERVHLYGGTLRSGHTASGGFAVTATLRRDGTQR